MLKSLALVALMATSTAQVGSFSSSDLPADAQWYVHVNLDVMQSSSTGQVIFAESIGEAFEDIQRDVGIDLSGQIDSVTISGASLPPDQPAILLRGELSLHTQTQIIDLMRQEGDVFIEEQYAGLTYYGFDQDGHRGSHAGEDMLYIAFGIGSTMVSPSEQVVRDYLANGAEPATRYVADPNAMLVLHAEQAMVQGGVDARDVDVPGGWDSEIVSNIDSAALVLADAGGDMLSFDAEIVASTEEHAFYIHNVVQGLLSLKALESGDSNEEIKAFLMNAHVDSQGNLVTMSAMIPLSLLEEVID